MGYSSLKNVNSSDMASDLFYSCQCEFIKQLTTGLKEIENCYNTSGWINVALIIETGVLDKFDILGSAKIDWKFLVEKLKEEVQKSSKAYATEWDSEENRNMHHLAFKRMLRNVKKFLNKKEIAY